MKLFKKTISVFLASVMCIPTGVISVAQAAEGETASGTYTVTVKEAAGGSMKISEESMSSSTASQDGYQLVTVGEDGNLEKADNDGTFWAFSKGDTVEIECQPDDGYSVQLFTITNATTGKVLAEKETSDNFFSFKMPGQSVAIEASFADYKTIPIVDDASDNNSDSANTETSDSQADDRKDIDASDVKDDSKGSEVKESEIEYHDVAETSEISEAEVDDVIADVVTESYIKTHVNEKYTRITDHIRVGNYMQITNTLFDGEKVSSDDTIDSIMSVIESGDASTEEKLTAVETVLGQSQATALLYNLDPDSDYLVGLVNTMYKDNDWHVQDVEFGKNSTDGLVVDGCIYDYKTGLGYFPKKLFINDKDENVLGRLRMQLMQVYDGNKDSSDAESQTYTTYVTNDDTIQLQSTDTSIYSGTTISIDPSLDPDKISVTVNGFPVDKSNYTAKRGEVILGFYPSSIASIQISEGERTVTDDIKEIFDEASAGTWTVGETPEYIKDLGLVGRYHKDTQSWDSFYPGLNPVAIGMFAAGGAFAGKTDIKYTSNQKNLTPVYLLDSGYRAGEGHDATGDNEDQTALDQKLQEMWNGMTGITAGSTVDDVFGGKKVTTEHQADTQYFNFNTKLTEWKATNVPKAADFGPRAATLGITDSGANSVSSLLTAFINGIAYR